jgi:glycine/D-amino acid oxidase-like deaminating enzyme
VDLAAVRRSYADAEPRPFWLAQPGAPRPGDPLEGAIEADLVVVGGTGLWAALLAKEEDAAREVVLLEGERVAFGATGRNGGLMDASLTHGIENGVARWPDEMPRLERLGRANFEGIQEAMAWHGIDAGFEATGELAFATAPYQAWWIPELVGTARRYGWRAESWGAERARQEVHSPTYHGAAHLPDGRAVVDPARLAWGLARAARASGVRVYERSPVTGLKRIGDGIEAATREGRVFARRAILATSAFPPLVKAIRRYVVPVYDYVLVSEPLTPERRSSLGWQGRQGLTDLANQFHYYRLTSDDRVLWGGYDAVYNFRKRHGPAPRRAAGHVRAARHPLLRDLPAARGRPLHAPLGRGDRHLLALLGHVRQGARRPRRLRRRLHRAGRGSELLRRAGRARLRRRPRHRAHPPEDGPHEAGPLPARAAPLGRHHPDPPRPSPRPTGARAAAGRGSRRSTGSGWASIAEGVGCRAAPWAAPPSDVARAVCSAAVG